MSKKNGSKRKKYRTDGEFYWDWVLHEDHTFTNRGSFLLASLCSLLQRQLCFQHKIIG